MASTGAIAARRMDAEIALTKNVQNISRALGLEVVRLPVNARQKELQEVQRLEMLVTWTGKVIEALVSEEGLVIEPPTPGEPGVLISDEEAAGMPNAEIMLNRTEGGSDTPSEDNPPPPPPPPSEDNPPPPPAPANPDEANLPPAPLKLKSK